MNSHQNVPASQAVVKVHARIAARREETVRCNKPASTARETICNHHWG